MPSWGKEVCLFVVVYQCCDCCNYALVDNVIACNQCLFCLISRCFLVMPSQGAVVLMFMNNVYMQCC